MKLERPDLWLAACIELAEAYENDTAKYRDCPFCCCHLKLYHSGCERRRPCVWQYFTGGHCVEQDAYVFRISKDPEWRTRRIKELRTEWIPALEKLVAESEKGE